MTENEKKLMGIVGQLTAIGASTQAELAGIKLLLTAYLPISAETRAELDKEIANHEEQAAKMKADSERMKELSQ